MEWQEYLPKGNQEHKPKEQNQHNTKDIQLSNRNSN